MIAQYFLIEGPSIIHYFFGMSMIGVEACISHALQVEETSESESEKNSSWKVVFTRLQLKSKNIKRFWESPGINQDFRKKHEKCKVKKRTEEKKKRRKEKKRVWVRTH